MEEAVKQRESDHEKCHILKEQLRKEQDVTREQAEIISELEKALSEPERENELKVQLQKESEITRK